MVGVGWGGGGGGCLRPSVSPPSLALYPQPKCCGKKRSAPSARPSPCGGGVRGLAPRVTCPPSSPGTRSSPPMEVSSASAPPPSGASPMPPAWAEAAAPAPSAAPPVGGITNSPTYHLYNNAEPYSPPLLYRWRPAPVRCFPLAWWSVPRCIIVTHFGCCAERCVLSLFYRCNRCNGYNVSAVSRAAKMPSVCMFFQRYPATSSSH